MTIRFYKFGKRINSTKIPVDGDCEDVEANVILKDGCTITNPVVELANIDGAKMYKYNYAYIPDFSRYYYISEWKFVNRVLECHMTVDVLSSFKLSIVLSEQYVARADVEIAQAANVLDTTPLLTADFTSAETSGSQLYESGYTDGFFIVGIISPNAAMGSVDYYYFQNISEMKIFTSKLLGDVDWLNVGDISDELTKCLINPMQYVASCKFFPLHIDGITTSTAPIKLGFWDLGITGSKLTKLDTTAIRFVSVPKHPQMGEVGVFANIHPYAQYTFNLDPFGSFPLDSAKLANMDEIECRVNIDFTTGEAKLYIFGGSNSGLVSINYGKVGVDIPLSTATTGILGIAAGAVGGFVQEFSGFLGNELASAATGVCNTIAGAASNVHTQGSQNTRAFLVGSPKIYAHFQNISTEYISKFGRAVCKTMKIGDIRGFVKCVNPVLDNCIMTDSEHQQVLDYMTRGFYNE